MGACASSAKDPVLPAPGGEMAAWLESLRAGYGDKFSGVLVAAGYETALDLFCATGSELTSLRASLVDAGAKPPHLRLIRDAIQTGLIWEGALGDDWTIQAAGNEKRRMGPRRRRLHRLCLVPAHPASTRSPCTAG